MCDLKATRQIFDPLQTFSSSLFTLHVKEGSTWVKLILYLPPQKYQAWQTCNTGIVSELSFVGLWNFQNVRSRITWISFFYTDYTLNLARKLVPTRNFHHWNFIVIFTLKLHSTHFPVLENGWIWWKAIIAEAGVYRIGLVFMVVALFFWLTIVINNSMALFWWYFFLLLVSKQGRICCLDCEWRIGALFGLWMEFWGTLIRLANLSIWEADPIFNLGCCCFRGHKIEPVIYG